MDDPLSPIVISVILLLLAAVIRAASAALSFVDEGATHELAGEGDVKARLVLRLMKRSDVSAFDEFQMAHSFLLMGASIAACAALVGRIARSFTGLSETAATLAAALCVLIPFSLIAFVLAGAIPGHLAAHWRQKLLDRVAPLADGVLTVLSPVTRLSLWLGRALLRPFHIRPADAGDLVTEEDIRQLVDMGEEKGAIESDEREMIENIFEFNNMDAGDCMIHRKDITAIDVEDTDGEILKTIRESGLSRFPVYEDNLDNVLGILTTRDYLISRCSNEKTPLRQLIRPAHFVPESVRTDVLFQEMQSRKQHMAIVVDEYGGTSGLITLEDLLEEIVGNIYDEFDPKEEPDITPLGENRWRVSGAAELETLSEALDIDLPTDEEFDTLGGLVFSRLTEIPADGEHPVVTCHGLRISVEKIEDRRVEWAVVEKLDEQDQGEDKAASDNL